MIYTRTTTHSAGIHNTHALINERTYAHQVTAESVHAAHIDSDHNAQSVHDNNAYACPAGPHQSPAAPSPPPPPHAPHAPHTAGLTNPTPTDTSILLILGAVLALLVCRISVTNTPPRTLIRVSDTRGRALCSKCHGENNDAFHFCQWCVAPSTYGSWDSDTALLCIDENATVQRFAQFTKAMAGKVSTRRRGSASLLYERCLQSRVSSRRPSTHGHGPTQQRSSFPMLARLLFREERYIGPRQTLQNSRYIRTAKLLNDGIGVYPTVRTRLLQYELPFQARHGIRTRPGGNTRLERYAEDGPPSQKQFSHAIHDLRKGRAEEGRSRSITSTCSTSQPPRDNHRTHDTSHTVHTGPLR